MGEESEFQLIGRIRYQDTHDNFGKNYSATLHIPENLIKQKKTEGLTLYFNLFWVLHAKLHDRNIVDYKLMVKASSQDVRIGDKNYTAPYATVDIILPPEEWQKLSKLFDHQKPSQTDQPCPGIKQPCDTCENLEVCLTEEDTESE